MVGNKGQSDDFVLIEAITLKVDEVIQFEFIPCAIILTDMLGLDQVWRFGEPGKGECLEVLMRESEGSEGVVIGLNTMHRL